MTTSADLVSTGFISITTNMVGAKNYSINYPRANILSDNGVMGTQNKQQIIELLQNIFCNVGTIAPTGTPIPAEWPINANQGAVIGGAGYGNVKTLTGIGGGASYENSGLNENPFWISATTEGVFGTPIYASNVASKLSSPFYLVRSTFPQDSFKYINNATPSTIMPIVGIINLQYGATTDYYWSNDVSTLSFTAKTNMSITDIPILLTDNMGNPAITLEGNSTVFFKVTRNQQIPDIVDGELSFDLQRLEDSLDKDKRKQLQMEMDEMVDADKN